MKTFMIARLALLTAAGFAISLSMGPASASSDWPQWRGPNRDGHSSDTGLLKRWPEGGPKLCGRPAGWEAVTRA